MPKELISIINELKQKNEELQKENEMLKAIIDSVHESVYAVNEKDEIILYNSESEKMEGLNRQDLLGKKEDEVFAPPYYFSDEVTTKVLRTGKPLIEQPYWYHLHDGRKTNMIYSAFPFYFNGQVAAVYVIFRNMNQISDFISITLEMQKKFNQEENNHHQGTTFLLEDIKGNGTMKRITEEARKIARRNSPVLIIGETGTGKELFAQGIHNASLHSKGPFIPINCAAIPETLLESLLFGTVKGAFTGATESPGLFEQASDGTIFLDEINSMSLPLQAKLLRILQDRTVRRLGSTVEIPLNCRIISATNMDPIETVEKKIMRSDLYFRLATVTLYIPPLRERKEDIQLLAMHFIKKYNNEFGLFINKISVEVIEHFEHYHWPGNVRELENFIEGAMNFVQPNDRILKLNHLPEYFRERIFQVKEHQKSLIFKGKLQNVLQETEKALIESILADNKGNITRASQELGISRQNLHHKLKSLGIESNSIK